MPYKPVKMGQDKQTDNGRDFKTINAKGYTPALKLDDGTILTESAAILAYIVDKSGKLLAKDGLDRWRALEATEFMTTELHTNFRPFFYPDTTVAEKDSQLGRAQGGEGNDQHGIPIPGSGPAFGSQGRLGHDGSAYPC